VQQFLERTGIEHYAARVAKGLGPGALGTRVTVQPPNALKQHVHRTQVGDQQIGIEIKALLHRLGGDDDRACASRRVLTEARLDSFVELASIVFDEA